MKRINPKAEAMRVRSLIIEQLSIQGAEATDVIELESAIKGLGTDEEKVYQFIQNVSKEDFEKMNTYFKDKYNETAEEFILNDFSGEEYNKVSQLLSNLLRGGKKIDANNEFSGIVDQIFNSNSKEELEELINNTPNFIEIHNGFDERLRLEIMGKIAEVGINRDSNPDGTLDWIINR
jgi:Ran GTPase-activating protein (RanGAP) involved in mRNA processing and transport